MDTRASGEQTRAALLEAAQAEFYHHGFQGASLSRILRHAGVSRGGLDHHFEGKSELGYAVVEEVIRERIGQWGRELLAADDPLEALLDWLRAAPSEATIRHGCPLNNLAMEMSSVDEEFRRRVRETFTAWEETIAQALRTSQARGDLRPDIDPMRVARFLLASFEGGMGFAKNEQSRDRLHDHTQMLIGYVEGLRPDRSPSADLDA